ncbi:MAG: phbC [Rickettsiaceae bacterium]|jgi:polyhydroxyalkanoate synthase|nr:phbC [Rickettsiaceae bacterium]
MRKATKKKSLYNADQTSSEAANMNEPEDFQEYINNLCKMAALYNQAAKETIENSADIDMPPAYKQMASTIAQINAKFLEHPEKFYEKQLELYSDYLNVWNNSWQRYLGESAKPLYQADPRDKRFKDSAWNEDLVFDFMKQSYLVTNKWLHNMIHDLKGVDKKTAEKFEFYTKQLIDAMSPSNFAFTNPEVIKEAINTNGASLMKGFQNLLRDLDGNKLDITTADIGAFKLGENLATSPGKVIYKNDLMELIQYEPVEKQTYQTPVLIIPAWINKYYILDLSESNSYAKWLLKQGYTVFMISWVNPDKSLAHKKFEDYMLEGPLAALTEIEKATGEKEVTAVGYCLGGTLLSCTMAYLKSKNDTRIKAASLLTTMVDFGNVGEMSVFIDEKQLEELDKKMKETGFLGGDELAAMFSAIRANDLIWSFVINNYLLGKNPMPFDILYWNADTTRMPANAHSFYLHNMYLKNLLGKPNGINLAGTPIDVTKIDTPCYILATLEDHIAPWQTTFETTKLFKGKNRFVLAGSGHIAGVINPPDKNKYGFWLNDKQSSNCQQWLLEAKQYDGSWWNDWHEWNKKFSTKKVTAPKPAKGICDAPGAYVKVK